MIAAGGAGRTWQATLQTAAEHTVAARATPGMVIAVAHGQGAAEHVVVGQDGSGTPLAADSLAPVASITKLATALAVLRLVAAGTLALDDPLALHLPNAAAAQPGITLRALLAHTAGLPDDLPPGAAPYRPGLDWPALARACLRTPPSRPPGQRVVYSNVGMGLLAVVVERRTGVPFAAALEQLVLEPLGIEGYLGVEPARTPARLAGYLGEHTGTPLEPFNTPFWRGLALPWAGLVTTAAGALELVRAFARTVPCRPAFLPPALAAEATRDQTGGLPGGFGDLYMDWDRCPWGLGVELRGDKTPHQSPPAASPASFGHLGASGCLAWADPARAVAWAAVLGPRSLRSWETHWAEIGNAILGAAGPTRA
jgi:beta-lactamase class C